MTGGFQTNDPPRADAWSSYSLPMPVGERRMAVLAEGSFSPLGAKTAVCLARYVPREVVAVIDSTRAPSTVERVLGFGGGIPIVASLEEALAYGPNVLALGTAPRGGALAEEDRASIVEAIERGLHVASGMHSFLGDDPDLALRARRRGVVLWDARRVPDDLSVSSGKGCPGCPVILTVGSDCNTGKMTTALELHEGLAEAGVRSAFAASGQTGIMIAGWGIPVDRVVADFVGGATERLVREAARGKSLVVLEGQGSIIHPGYAGVTFAMLAGSLPDALILCHQPTRTTVRSYNVPIPPIAGLALLYERAIEGIRRVPVIGIALNTFDMEEDAARRAVSEASRETGLPAADPIRFGRDPLVSAARRSLSL